MPEKIFTVEENDAGLRLDVFLVSNMEEEVSRTSVKKLIDAGQVLVNNNKVSAHHKVVLGEKVSVDDFLIKPEEKKLVAEDISLNIFYEDDRILIVNKPEGLLVHPAQGAYSGTLVNALMNHCDKLSDLNDDFRPGIVHRLDRETSGLLVVAKDNKIHAYLAKQFERHQIKKQYIALVQGDVKFDEGMIDAPLGRHSKFFDQKEISFADDFAKDAVTYYRVLKRFKGNATLIALFPKTGRTHQLRVHMKHLGHPILGDEKYGRKETFPRMALHAQALGFMYPDKESWIEFFCPAPKEFLCLDFLK